MNHAVFLDRDGTLLEEVNFLHRAEEVVLVPGAATALRGLRDAGFKLFIVTNQSGVGHGYFTLDDVENVHRRIREELEPAGVRFERIYIAPETSAQPAHGRKPSPRFLFEARDEFGVDLARSYMIGDRLSDVECGANAGVRKSLLVRTGYGAGTERNAAEKLRDKVIVDNLAEAARWILGDWVNLDLGG